MRNLKPKKELTLVQKHNEMKLQKDQYWNSSVDYLEAWVVIWVVFMIFLSWLSKR